MEKSLVFGGRCTVLSMSYSQERLSWRTCQLSLFEGLEQYLDRYPKLGTMRSGVLYELQISEPLIRERDGSASLIPPQCLTADGLLPTPTKSGSEHRTQYSQGGRPLMFMLIKGYLPTPTSRMWRNSPATPGAWNQHTDPNVEYAKAFGITQEEAIGNNFRLSPRFVEEMMGFPIGWTELQP